MSVWLTRMLKPVIEHPYLNILVGVVFLYSGVSETIQQFEELEEFRVGVHHGVILFALLHILKALPELFEGVAHIEEGNERS